jgi:hypothetical protein
MDDCASEMTDRPTIRIDTAATGSVAASARLLGTLLLLSCP